MVRQGALTILIIGLAACTQDVDDPANFTAGNSQGNNTTSTSTTTSGPDTDSASGVVDAGNSATTTGGGIAESTTASTIGPADSGNGLCGNGVMDMGEQCDGADLQGFDCASLGLGMGTLACDQEMCMFDTSMCMPNPGGTSG